MDATTIVYTLLLAIAGTAAIILIPEIRAYFSIKRLLQRFAQLRCGACQKALGIEAVRTGTDISPFEELWSDDNRDFIHHYPTCVSVVCPHCQHRWVLRHNSEGETFGPELSVHEPSQMEKH